MPKSIHERMSFELGNKILNDQVYTYPFSKICWIFCFNQIVKIMERTMMMMRNIFPCYFLIFSTHKSSFYFCLLLVQSKSRGHSKNIIAVDTIIREYKLKRARRKRELSQKGIKTRQKCCFFCMLRVHTLRID